MAEQNGATTSQSKPTQPGSKRPMVLRSQAPTQNEKVSTAAVATTVGNGAKPVSQGTPKPSVTTKAVVKTAATAVPKRPSFVIATSKSYVPSIAFGWLKLGVYGAYGAGKTRLAGSACLVPEARDVLVISAESGHRVLKPWIDKDLIDFIIVNSYKQLSRIYEFLRFHCRYRDIGTEESEQKLREREAFYKDVDVSEIVTPRHYRTIVVDTLSEVNKYCMYQLIGIDIGSTALDAEWPDVSWDEYRNESEMVRLLIRSIRDLPMNSIFTMAEEESEDKQKQKHTKPSMTPRRLAGDVQGFLDVVGYLELVPNEEDKTKKLRRLHLTAGKSYKGLFFDAKHRFAEFDDRYIDNPTMRELSAINAQGVVK